MRATPSSESEAEADDEGEEVPVVPITPQSKLYTKKHVLSSEEEEDETIVHVNVLRSPRKKLRANLKAEVSSDDESEEGSFVICSSLCARDHLFIPVRRRCHVPRY